ncbi:MAG: glycosyltransferase family 2 protein [Clostridia bacterium]|nr:glycosyltransferase family 2 protein [Clostridia bacterium]
MNSLPFNEYSEENSMQKPLVNVIMPAYNAQEYIAEALKSVMAQDYPNIKIYVVNDCSTDQTLSVIQKNVSGDQRVTVIDLEKNGGPTHARNCALGVIDGEFFTFVDSDDRVEKDHVSTLMEMMSDDCVLATSGMKQQKRSKKDFKQKQGKVTSFTIADAKREVVGDRTFSAFSCSKIYRRSICGDLRFSDNIQLCEDTVFCLEYLTRANYGRVYYTTKRTYHYFRTKGSLSGLTCSEKKFNGISVLKQKVYEVRQRECEDKELVSRINAWWFLMQLQFMLYARKLKKKAEKKQFVVEAKTYKKDFKKQRKNFIAPYRRFGGLLFSLMRIFL